MRSFSDPSGEFQIPHLPPGEYQLTISAEGFVERTLNLASPLGENETREISELRLAVQ